MDFWKPQQYLLENDYFSTTNGAHGAHKQTRSLCFQCLDLTHCVLMDVELTDFMEEVGFFLRNLDCVVINFNVSVIIKASRLFTERWLGTSLAWCQVLLAEHLLSAPSHLPLTPPPIYELCCLKVHFQFFSGFWVKVLLWEFFSR